MTKILFRKDRETGDIIALMPYEIAQYGSETFHTCYAHIGQHNAYADNYAAKCTERATPSEYAKLKVELERIGYVVEVITYADVVGRWQKQGQRVPYSKSYAKRRDARMSKIYQNYNPGAK